MKYNFLNQAIPQEKRKELNEKILYLINNNLCEKYNITKEIIYNSYTGEGGLHALNFKNFNSFYDYTKAKQEIENGQFFTGHQEAKFLIDCLGIKENETVLDLTCGKGDLFNFLPNKNNIYGNELDINAYNVCRYLYPNANITHGDMRDYKPSMLFDVIIGNPPFNLSMTYNKEKMLSQMVYIQKCTEILKTGGILALIVPKSFLDDDFSNKSDIEYMNENYSFIGQVLLNKNAFSHVGVDNFQTKIILFHKKSVYIPCKTFNNSFIDGNSNYIYDNCIKPIRAIKEQYNANIKLENFKNFDSNKDKNFNDTVTKILFDIKRSKHVKHKYNECFNYYQQYYNQVKPESMKYEEWESIRITKKDVIDMLKNTLSSQHKKKSTYKNNMEKVLRRKEKEYINQSQKFDDMTIDKNIENWLSESKVFDNENDCNILLNDVQKEIVNKMLQKRYGYIQANQGTGKTLMGIHYALYKKDINNTRNTLIIAPSIAINGTWVTNLENYKIPFTTIKTLSDIKNIKSGDFILITFNMLCKYQNRIKKYLKSISNKYTLLVDEADSICNIDSTRTKAVLSVCKKARYKLLLSGTMTRNNINEAYTQFKLLYGESQNFICDCENIYQEDKKTKELLNAYNEDFYNKAYPPYKKGLKLFRECFNPLSVSVFGVGKNTQNIYNAKILKELIDKTIITKSFEDVVGKKIYSIHQHLVKFNSAEKKLYNKAINEFHSMKYLFTSTGSPRKDRMMEIIQQINLLLDVCSQPQSYKEYNSKKLPSKYVKVLELLNKWNDENVAIGCRTLKEVNLYTKVIKENISNRNLYIITGATTMQKRKDIINQLREDKTGILLSTQQALSSSINIGFVDKIILTRFSWNLSTLSQYYFRFIRYDSTRQKEVHFISYENSLENNLLKLIMSKEELTRFMKNQEQEKLDIEEELGVDFNLIDLLLSKEKDDAGKYYIRWGEQEII